MLAGDAARYPLLASAQLGAAPALLGLWLLLGIGQLRLAWALLNGDWTRMADAGALIAAAMITLLLFSQVLLVQITSLLQLGAGFGAETLRTTRLALSATYEPAPSFVVEGRIMVKAARAASGDGDCQELMRGGKHAAPDHHR
jgi:hypothetical protein